MITSAVFNKAPHAAPAIAGRPQTLQQAASEHKNLKKIKMISELSNHVAESE